MIWSQAKSILASVWMFLNLDAVVISIGAVLTTALTICAKSNKTAHYSAPGCKHRAKYAYFWQIHRMSWITNHENLQQWRPARTTRYKYTNGKQIGKDMDPLRGQIARGSFLCSCCVSPTLTMSGVVVFNAAHNKTTSAAVRLVFPAAASCHTVML